MFTGREWNGVMRLTVTRDGVAITTTTDFATYWRACASGARGRGRSQAAKQRRARRAFQTFPRG